MVVRYIPQEIWDATIDELANDPVSLKETSLTCRSWHSRSRKHLFRQILIDDEPTHRRYEKLIEASTKLAEIAIWSVDKLFPLLPAVHSVRTLNIVLPLQSLGSPTNRGQQAQIPQQQLITLIQPLPNLHELVLSSNFDFPSIYIESSRFPWDVSYCNVLRNLRKLELWTPVFISPSAVRQILTTCPSLIDLHIAEADYKPKDMKASPHAQSSNHAGTGVVVPGISAIQRLKITHTPVSAWSIVAGPFLQSAPSSLRVRELTVDIPNDQMGYYSRISDLCKACSTSLEQLEISMIIYDKINDIYPDISLMICPVRGEFSCCISPHVVPYEPNRYPSFT